MGKHSLIDTIFLRTKLKQEEELQLLCELYKTAAHKNLREAEFWRNMSVNYGFVPEVLPAELLQLSRLGALEYQPNLGNIPERFCWLFFTEVRIRIH